MREFLIGENFALRDFVIFHVTRFCGLCDERIGGVSCVTFGVLGGAELLQNSEGSKPLEKGGSVFLADVVLVVCEKVDHAFIIGSFVLF